MDLQGTNTGHVLHGNANGIFFEIAIGHAPDGNMATVHRLVDQIDGRAGNLFQGLIYPFTQNTIVL